MVVPDPRTHVHLGPEKISNISTTEFPHHYPDEDHSWNLEEFREKVSFSVKELSKDRIECDLVGVDASIANAIRRVLLSDVPTIAIEKVFMLLNTSIVQDEVLAQRLGLVPLAIRPDLIEPKLDYSTDSSDETNTVVFKLAVKCTRKAKSDLPKPSGSGVKLEPDQLYHHASVYSSDLEWQPQGNQEEDFPTPAGPVQDKILLAKLRPGQEIICEMHCHVGVARDHAKWSPVATASYRLLPSIDILQPIPPEHQDFFVQCFPAGVAEKDPSSEMGVRIVEPRKDTVSREVLRHDQFKGKVALGRKRDHFIFSIESAGQYEPQELVPAAIKTLLGKIRVIKEAVQEFADR